MDAQTLAELAGSSARLNFLYVVAGLFVIMAAFGFVVLLGEKTIGFDLKKFINNVEREADNGNCDPGVKLVLGVMALLGVVLWLGLR